MAVTPDMSDPKIAEQVSRGKAAASDMATNTMTNAQRQAFVARGPGHSLGELKSEDERVPTMGHSGEIGVVGAKSKTVPHLAKGTPFVHKGGLAVLHHGERVMPKEENSMYSLASHSLSGGSEDSTPEKKVKEIRIRKAKSGHISEHHHVSPMHHPMEEHVTKTMDDLHDHISQHMGQPSDEEASADAGQSGIPEGMGAAQVAPTEGSQG